MNGWLDKDDAEANITFIPLAFFFISTLKSKHFLIQPNYCWRNFLCNYAYNTVRKISYLLLPTILFFTHIGWRFIAKKSTFHIRMKVVVVVPYGTQCSIPIRLSSVTFRFDNSPLLSRIIELPNLHKYSISLYIRSLLHHF